LWQGKIDDFFLLFLGEIQHLQEPDEELTLNDAILADEVNKLRVG